MLWNQSETDTPRREKFGRCHAAARAHPPRPVRPPRSGRAQSKRDLPLRNDRFIAREAIYKEISFINQCKCCVFCENPAKLFIASRHSYRRAWVAPRSPSSRTGVWRSNPCPDILLCFASRIKARISTIILPLCPGFANEKKQKSSSKSVQKLGNLDHSL